MKDLIGIDRFIDIGKLRLDLVEYMKKNPNAFTLYANEIGVAYNSLRDFFDDEGKASLNTILRIYKFIYEDSKKIKEKKDE